MDMSKQLLFLASLNRNNFVPGFLSPLHSSEDPGNEVQLVRVIAHIQRGVEKAEINA